MGTLRLMRWKNGAFYLMMGTLRLMRWGNMVHFTWWWAPYASWDGKHGAFTWWWAPYASWDGKHGDHRNADMSLPIETILLIIQICRSLKRCENVDNRDENSAFLMMGTLRLMRWENGDFTWWWAPYASWDGKMVILPDDGHPTPHEMANMVIFWWWAPYASWDGQKWWS